MSFRASLDNTRVEPSFAESPGVLRTPPLPLVLCGTLHPAVRKKRGDHSLEHQLFAAAAVGCLACVRYYVEEKNVDPGVRSASQRYTPLSWAEFGESGLGNETGAVQRYLKTHCAGPTQSAERRAHVCGVFGQRCCLESRGRVPESRCHCRPAAFGLRGQL